MTSKLKEYLVTFPSSVMDTGYYEYRVAGMNVRHALKQAYGNYCEDDDVRQELVDEQGAEDGDPDHLKFPTLKELLQTATVIELVPYELEPGLLDDHTKTYDVTVRFQVTAGSLEGAYCAAYDHLSESEADDFATGIIIDEVLSDAE